MTGPNNRITDPDSQLWPLAGFASGHNCFCAEFSERSDGLYTLRQDHGVVQDSVLPIRPGRLPGLYFGGLNRPLIGIQLEQL